MKTYKDYVMKTYEDFENMIKEFHEKEKSRNPYFHEPYHIEEILGFIKGMRKSYEHHCEAGLMLREMPDDNIQNLINAFVKDMEGYMWQELVDNTARNVYMMNHEENSRAETRLRHCLLNLGKQDVVNEIKEHYEPFFPNYQQSIDIAKKILESEEAKEKIKMLKPKAMTFCDY